MLRRKHNLNCMVEDCTTKAYSSRPVFSFPRNPETGKLWRQALGIHPEAEVLSSEGVCSLHFAEGLVMKDAGDPNNMWLKPGAVPGAGPAPSKTGHPTRNHCRMCGENQGVRLKNKVSALRRNQHLLPVLDMCLDLNSEINTLLPDGVCEGCTKMVRFITKFAEDCWSAQETLAELYAPGRGFKVEPWKKITSCPKVPPENGPLQLVENNPEPKSVINEDSSDSEMIEVIPVQEVKHEPELQINDPECSQQATFEPEETPQLPQEPYDQPKPSMSKSPKKSDESTPPAAKRPRPTKGCQVNASDTYGCDFCSQKFAIKKHLDQHIRTHVSNLPKIERKRELQVSQFICLRCRARFSTAEELKTHTVTQHMKTIECRDCKMTFHFDSLLEKHNAQVHPERVQKKNTN